MAKVVNDIVKLDWEKSGWLQTKATAVNPNGCFLFATKIYKNSEGTEIPVYFTSSTAFLWVFDYDTDEEEICELPEFKDWVKGNFDYSFPTEYAEYVPIIEEGLLKAKPEILERFGLTEYKEDIEARLKDLLAYGEEHDVGM